MANDLSEASLRLLDRWFPKATVLVVNDEEVFVELDDFAGNPVPLWIGWVHVLNEVADTVEAKEASV